MMEFERAIEDAETLFLFDRRSVRQLQAMADEAPPNSRDRYLIRLTQAAFAYYNSADAQNVDIVKIINQALGILNEVKRFREDRVFFTLALRFEVDLLMHLSALRYREAPKAQKSQTIFNEEDIRVLSICETLLKNFPASFDPLPSTWYSGVLPLFPIYRDEVVLFYKDRVQEHRIVPLTAILIKVQYELTLASGIIQTKKFIADNNVYVKSEARVNKLLISNTTAIGRFVERSLPQTLHLASDISLPRGIGHSQLEKAIHTVEGQISQAHTDKDIRRFTGHLLQLGILNFLEDNPEDTVSALVRTLKASARIGPEDKKLRQYQHERFPDIPFMLGTAFLRSVIDEHHLSGRRQALLENSSSGLMRSLVLQKRYHQAYINLVVTLYHLGDVAQCEQMFKLYLETFEHDIAGLNGNTFRNLAFLEHQENGEELSADVVKWILLAEFCTGGVLTKAQQMIQELKTLYILNAHDFTIGYLESYRMAFRLKEEDFIKELENNELHSALLFYLAHAYSSLSLLQGKNTEELVIEYANLDQGIELNTEALYFNPKNASALRLVETQSQIIRYALQRSQKRWDNINNAMGQRFQFYEDYLRQEKCLTLLRENLSNLNLSDRVPDLKLSDSVLARMHEVINVEQRERLKHRVEAT